MRCRRWCDADGVRRGQKLDRHTFRGHPVPDAGAGATSGPKRTLAITAITPTRYRWTFAIAGKSFVAGVNTLAGDGRTLTEMSWRVNASPKPPDGT